MRQQNLQVALSGVGKRYGYEWILRRLEGNFASGQQWAVLGPNGSGKSTLLQLIAGNLTPSVGQVSYALGGIDVSVDSIYKYLAWAAPYIELIEDFSLCESFTFHRRFKPFLGGLSTSEAIAIARLEHAAHKPIRYFSSGMKQRAKLALAVLSDVPMLLLDEPTVNLDSEGIAWYRNLIADYAHNRLLFVASNQPHEYDFCQHHIVVADYK